MTDQEINHLIATSMIGWGYSASSDTYWVDFGVPVGDAKSFDPMNNEHQRNLVVSELELPCTPDTLKEYVLGLTLEQRREISTKYRKKRYGNYIYPKDEP